MKRRVPLLFFLFYFFICYSQEYSIQLYNTDNGLPQNSVKDIIKDKYGFIWLTTENGIVRYDGTHFLVYKNFPFSSQRFTYFYGHPEKDSIYTAGDFEKTVLLHAKFPKVAKPLKNFTTFLTKNKSHYLLYCSNFSYAATSVNFYINFKKGRYYLKKNELIYTDFKSKAEENLQIKSIYNNVPRVFAINEVLFHIDPQSKKISKIEKGKITGSYNVPLLTDTRSRILWSQVNNQVFIVNRNTIYTCNYDNGELKISRLLHLNQARDENFVSAYYDKSYKKFYLGSSIGGLQIISLTDFATVTRPPSKPESNFYSLLPFSSSSVITPFGEIYDRKGFIGNKKFEDANSFFLDYDYFGNIITQKANDVMIYQKASFYKDTVSIKNFSLKDFFFDQNRYYALFSKLKIGKFPEFKTILTVYKDKSFKYPQKNIYINKEPTKLIKFDEDHILVGTAKALYKVSLKTNKIYNLTGKDELFIRNIIRSKDGVFWIMTLGKGFYMLKNDHLIKMPYDVNNNISSSHTILEDSKGFFWIPTNNGLYKVPETQLLQYAQNRKSKVSYYRFSKDSGFNTNEFNGGSNICGIRLENGEFVLPSLNGLVFFDPLKVTSYYPENIYIERALIDSKEQYFKENLYLKQESNRVDIFIDVPYYSNPDNLVIEAKLSGMPNAKWEPIGKEGKFSISNLGYGNHTFVVKMLVSDKGKFIYKKINIIIPPYFYQTLWFKLFVFSVILLMLYFLVRWRINFLERKNHKLEEIVSSRTKSLSDTVEKLEITKNKLHKEIEQQKKLIGTISHDITTPVKFIAMTAKEVLDKDDFNEQRIKKILNSVYKSSDQLYNFTITLKEYADIYSHYRSDKTELYSLYKLIEEKKILFNEIAEKNNTAIINKVDQSLLIWISKNILSAIIHNLVDNSVKYTQNGSITVESNTEGENIILLITDTGIGMDEKKIEYYTTLQDNIENEKLLLQKYGMGLHLVLQLLQMIEGKIVFTKNRLQGTSFKLILKNKKND
ncbi:signal transduction histidine kinase [Chryseobacterium ginsenosidimutans]|uniref:sensor histidine kinase n=1 Tax=Chryseobacterium ginsenosidimutans TaxID=687846 RepID=UPI002787BDAA|nr:HAMP domain-containing sensor histidine kinase [Chryseobacterium ginsenosidimutans]MDQ0593948.1 signal transduction histidine kinase [Chryseobacterium ginsenosidimutans]